MEITYNESTLWENQIKTKGELETQDYSRKHITQGKKIFKFRGPKSSNNRKSPEIFT